MKIIRYQTAQNEMHYGALQPDGSAREISGDIFDQFEVTGKTVKPHKLLAPIMSANLFCIGLNYRRHAEESKAVVPEYPISVHEGHYRSAEPR